MSAGARHLVAGSASVRLAASMGEAVGVAPVARVLERFPVGEIHVRLHDELRDDDVCLRMDTLVTTDALEVPDSDPHVVTVGLGDRLGEVVHRLHHAQPLDELAAHR